MSGTLTSSVDPAVVTCVFAKAAVGAGVGACGAASTLPTSSNKITTSPSEILSPIFTFTSLTTPACDEGTSIVALSDSKVTNDCSFSTRSPALT